MTWKTQLTVANNIEITQKHSDNIEIMISDEADEVIK